MADVTRIAINSQARSWTPDLLQYMASRTPSPDYTHPAAFFTPPTQSEEVFSPCCCCVVFIQHCLPQRRASETSWNVTSPRRPDPWSRLQTEIDSFVGWLLELLLRRRCSGVRRSLRVYALEFCL